MRPRAEDRPVVSDDGGGQYRVAVVQVPAVVLDRQATLARAVEKVGEAADNGARLICFSEAFVPGYPEWIWRLRPGNDFGTTSDIWDRFLAQTVDLERDELNPLRQAAKRRKVAISIGVNEREGGFSRTTVYNSLVVIGADGEIALRHRKLMPTNPERMVWGTGDGVGLEAVETAVGRVAGLICWENYMPLARFALFASGVQIYLAPTWDEGETWVASMRHIAFEGTCWVLGCGSLMRASDIPADLPMRAELYPDPEEWINPGDSVIVAPGGDIVAGPLHQAEGILYADCDPARSSRSRRTLDVAGHYGRPDVFHLTIDRSPRQPIS
jgi:nitrilase